MIFPNANFASSSLRSLPLTLSHLFHNVPLLRLRVLNGEDEFVVVQLEGAELSVGHGRLEGGTRGGRRGTLPLTLASTAVVNAR